MSTLENEVKAAVSQEAANLSGDATKAAAQVQAKASLDVSILKQRVTSLELQAEELYAKHTRLLIGIAVVVIGMIVGIFV